MAQTLLREGDYGELLADLLDVTIEGLAADRGFVVVREGTAGEAKFRAAEILGISREGLRIKMQRTGLAEESWQSKVES